MFLKALLTGFAAAALVLAQGGDMGGGGGDMGGGRGGGGGGGMGGGGGQSGPVQKPSKAEQLAERLKLNKDQKVEAQTIMDAGVKEASPVIQQLMQTRSMLATALANKKSDADVEPIVRQLTSAQMQITAVELATFQKLYATLKPNQTSKAPEAFDIMGGIFEPPAGGGRGMGRGMGGMRGGGGGR